ncbi:MAG: zinc ribbon domain-containing protein [Micromonosporaceae bacterium]
MNQNVPFLLRGLLRCELCQSRMIGIHTSGGVRVYTCGPLCAQDYVDATRAESDMLLAALIRATVTLRAELQNVEPGFRRLAEPLVDAEAMARWEACDITGQRTVIEAVFHHIDVTAEHDLRPVWRHAEVSTGASS